MGDTWEKEIDLELSKLEMRHNAEFQISYISIQSSPSGGYASAELRTKQQIDEIIDSLKKLREYLL